MNGRKKPRQPRWLPTAGTIILAKYRASKLRAHEIDEIISTTTASMVALREARATEHDWSIVAGMVNAALSIQQQGVVRILTRELHDAEAVANAIYQRAITTGTWRPPTLHGSEITTLLTAIHLHQFQLSNLSQGEAIRAINRAEADVQRQGGKVLGMPPPVGGQAGRATRGGAA